MGINNKIGLVKQPCNFDSKQTYNLIALIVVGSHTGRCEPTTITPPQRYRSLNRRGPESTSSSIYNIYTVRVNDVTMIPRIYLIEQRDEKPWNKGVLYNIGAKQAIADKFPCLILHDVDMLPLDYSNLYVCTTQPRHISASLDKFRYVLPYYGLVGGVLAMRADQYEAVDGFSNRFEGWGGEDDDMHARIISHNLSVVR